MRAVRMAAAILVIAVPTLIFAGAAAAVPAATAAGESVSEPTPTPIAPEVESRASDRKSIAVTTSYGLIAVVFGIGLAAVFLIPDKRQRARKAAAKRARAAMNGRAESDLGPWTAEPVGPERVGAALDALPGSAWWVLHDVRIGESGSDGADRADGVIVDHLVIGMGGVFSVITRDHRDANVWVTSRAVLIDGDQHRELLEEAVDAAARVRRRLAAAGVETTVVPMLVFVARNVDVTEPPTEVVAMGVGELRGWLEARPHTLSLDAVADLAIVADQPETWSHRSAAH